MKNAPEGFYKEKDKNLNIFLLASRAVEFCGTEVQGGTVYFLFKPQSEAVKLVNSYFSQKAPPIQPKSLLEAADNFRTILFRTKDEMSRNGENYGKAEN